MKKLLIIFSISILIFSCQKKQEVSVLQKPHKSALRLSNSDGYNYYTKGSGNFGNVGIWVKDSSGHIVDAYAIPDSTNNIFIQAGHSVTLDSNHSCKNLNLNTTNDSIRLNTGSYSLNVWGSLRMYSGAAPGTNDGTGNSNNLYQPFIAGNIVTKGGSRNLTNSGEWGAPLGLASYNLIIALDSGATGHLNTNLRAGNITVNSGILTQKLSSTLRVSGGNYSVAGNGKFTIKNGATFKTLQSAGIYQYQDGNNGYLDSFIVESGGNLIIERSYVIAAENIKIEGNTTLDGGAFYFPNPGNTSGASQINRFNNLTISGSGWKGLVNNIAITGDTTFIPPAYINPNGYTITYE